MGDQLIAQVRELCEGQIDFAGQKITDGITTWLLATTGLVAFIVGYLEQNIYYTMWAGLFGTFITFLIVVPPWPFYNKSPEPWIKESAISGQGIVIDGKRIN